MEINWEPIIWFVIWAGVILASVGIIIWASVAAIAASNFRKINKSMTSRSDDPFDTPFFRNRR